MNQNKYSVTVGIPAYNEEANIKKLIRSVLDQKTAGFDIKKIIVSSDGSTDSTVNLAKRIKDQRVLVIENKDRKGIARGLNQIIENADSDTLVTLDADVRLNNRNFLKKLIHPVIEENADLTSSSIKEILPETYIARVLNTSMKLKEVLFKVFKNGNNIYNCHGLARAYSRRFYNNLHFPVSIGNDMYCYLKALQQGYKFTYAADARAYYKLPENFEDHKKQSERFFVTETEMENIFGVDLVKKEIKIPIKVYFISAFKALKILLENPMDSIAYFFIQFYLRLKPKNKSVSNQAWKMATSSKNI
jgi:glycosyltransferase involved in cell wall biosynthesis